MVFRSPSGCTFCCPPIHNFRQYLFGNTYGGETPNPMILIKDRFVVWIKPELDNWVGSSVFAIERTEDHSGRSIEEENTLAYTTQ